MEHKHPRIVPNEFCVRTPGNAIIDFSAPDPEEVLLSDVLRGLGNAKRFFNQTDWSVLQHSLLVTLLGYQLPAGDLISKEDHITKTLRPFYGQGMPDARFSRRLLYHDAHEGYTGDLPKPLKMVLGDNIVQVEKKLDAAIGVKMRLLEISSEEVKCLKELDAAALEIERAYLRPTVLGPKYLDLLKECGTLPYLDALFNLTPEQQKVLFMLVDLKLQRNDVDGAHEALVRTDYTSSLDSLIDALA